MGAVVLACLISGGFGLIAGGYYSIMGWVITACLLLIVTTAAALVAGAGLLSALGMSILVILTFNIGLVLSLVIRTSAAPALERNLRKTLLKR
jgi:hypothetical protein